MDWSLILGILGIVVSILVGWLTYRLADRRAQSQRYVTAKATVLQELSKSLGEDSVPTPDILEATIRSVLREVGDPRVEIALDELLDDLVRQVTSDPFLDGERRRKLQGDIQKVRAEASAQRLAAPPEEVEVVSGLGSLKSSLWSTVAALAAASATMLAFIAATMEKGTINDLRLRKAFEDPREALILGVAVLVGLLPLVVEFLSPGFIKKFFKRDKDKS